MSRHPQVKWAQREDKVYLTVLLPDAKNPQVKLEPDGVFTFTATAGTEDHVYELTLNLHDKVDVEESKINIGLRSILCVVEKAEKKWWNKLLHGDEKAPHYVKVDWDKWVDEDDDTGAAAGPSDMDMGGMDFSKLGGMGGMGDMMGGMGGMGGMGDMMGGMGGMMGGMGGMGGMMGGMGGMGGMADMMAGMGGGMDDIGDEDSEEEGQEETAGKADGKADEKPKLAGGETPEGKLEAAPSS